MMPKNDANSLFLETELFKLDSGLFKADHDSTEL